MVPAMDGGMWEHPAVVANVATLRGRGVTVLEPDTGALASGLSGKGRLPEPDAIVEALLRVLTPVRDFVGERLVITAGPTREPIDPVRYISNRSSGKMGYGLAAPTLPRRAQRSEEHTSELQSPCNLVCRLLLEKKKSNN